MNRVYVSYGFFQKEISIDLIKILVQMLVNKIMCFESFCVI